jgi:uncharacterized protein (TIGR02145 family)
MTETPLEDGDLMQDMTAEKCDAMPVGSTGLDGVVTLRDARDNKPYYVKKMPDNQCWMVTNLAYEGGGDNTYGDTKPITLVTSGYGGGSMAVANDAPYFMNPGGSTDYTNTALAGGFYGRLYNWCAASGGQSSACSALPANSGHDNDISICPKGWRLPTGGNNSEESVLLVHTITGEKGANTDAAADAFNAHWLPVFSGIYINSFRDDRWTSYYWLSDYSGSSHPFSLLLVDRRATIPPFNGADPAYSYSDEYQGQAVRCLADF